MTRIRTLIAYPLGDDKEIPSRRIEARRTMELDDADHLNVTGSAASGSCGPE